MFNCEDYFNTLYKMYFKGKQMTSSETADTVKLGLMENRCGRSECATNIVAYLMTRFTLRCNIHIGGRTRLRKLETFSFCLSQ